MWIECSSSGLQYWWLCYYIDLVKCLWNDFFLSRSPSSITLQTSSTLCPFCSLFPSSWHIFTFPLIHIAFILSASSSIFLILHCFHVSVEYMMDEMEKLSILEEPVRTCPVPTPRTSVPSPSASPSLRHKSKYEDRFMWQLKYWTVSSEVTKYSFF